jgi:hypothetical protein
MTKNTRCHTCVVVPVAQTWVFTHWTTSQLMWACKKVTYLKKTYTWWPAEQRTWIWTKFLDQLESNFHWGCPVLQW